MVKSLLSFARQTTAEERQLDMNAILREEVGLLEHTTLARVRIALDLAADLRPIRGDASALAHGIMNLCVNAVDAMTEGGTLTLRSRNVNRAWIEISISDTGTGMTQEVLARAMDPFVTTKGQGKGTGLGLSMVYSTVMAHQGRMENHSKPGAGTCITLQFPVCEAERASQTPSSGTSPEVHPTRKTVLVIDDDELVQSSMEALLSALGHTAALACSGEQALEFLEGDLRPDLVILDLNMPGLGGAGTLPRLRARHPDLPVLLATGKADQDALDLIAAHPGATLLPKPFSLQERQAQLQALIQV
jgi:CheY-like chemotaxis protein/anti-sigma regulatory factor (Ser/Thr protein kinase)